MKTRSLSIPGASSGEFRAYDSLIIAAALFLVTGAVNLQMPLYRAYAAQAGYGNGRTALVFAAYVAGLLPTLLCFGGISDRIGRKRSILAGLASALSATLVMLIHPDMHVLCLARILQGIGVGLSMGAGSAYLAAALDEGRTVKRSASYVTVATSLGFGGGALFTGTVLLFGATLTPISYWIAAAATLACMALLPGVRGIRPIGGSLIRLPYFPPGVLGINLSIALAWAVTGVVISLLPKQLALHGVSAWAGHALFLVNGTGALVQPFARKLSPRKSLLAGFVALPIGFSCLLWGASTGKIGWVLAGAALAGSACYGFTYLGGLSEVTRIGGDQRARAVSGYFIFAYLGFGAPSVLLGFLADRFGLMPALIGFGILVILLCILLAALTGKMPSPRHWLMERERERDANKKPPLQGRNGFLP